MKALYLRAEGLMKLHPDSLLIKKIKELVEFDDITVKRDISDEEITKIVQDYDILFTIWDNIKLPKMLADNPGKLRYICNISGTIKAWIPACFIDHPTIQVTNWGDSPANGVAEGAVALLFTMLKNIPTYCQAFENGATQQVNAPQLQGTLDGCRVGVYGLGVIGRRFVEMIRPFRCNVSFYDPFCEEIPSGIKRCDSLDELFDNSDAFVIHAGLCEGTLKTVNAERLAKLPDGGIIINTARSGIIDEDALMAELETGRLRAGLDLMQTGDRFPVADHPGRKLKNLICTNHHIAYSDWLAGEKHVSGGEAVAIRNLTHFVKGEPLEFTFDMHRYNIST